MKAQSLDWIASSSRAARSSAARGRACPDALATVRSSARRAAKASSATAGESQVDRSFPAPQLDGASAAAAGSARSKQLGVERAADEAAARDAGAHPLDEVACVLARLRLRRVAVVRAAGVVPGPQVVDGAAVVVAVGGADGIAVAVVPD